MRVCLGVGERDRRDNKMLEGGSDTTSISMADLPHGFTIVTDKQLAEREVPAAGCVLIGWKRICLTNWRENILLSFSCSVCVNAGLYSDLN